MSESRDDRTTHITRTGHVAVSETTPSAPPIYQTTAFDVADLEMLEAVNSGAARGHLYTRDSNPNHAALGETIAELENAQAGAVFASGMGAIAAVVMSLAATGDHVLISRVLYGQTWRLAERLRTNFGIEVTAVDIRDPARVSASVRANTRLCLVETVSNPLLEVADIPALSAAIREVPLIVDSTFTTPELIRPLDHGAAAVIHSASKYLNGHGDVMLGVAAGSAELMSAATETASIFGQNANPFECWLTQRGLRTLPLRMRQICQTTTQLAQCLSHHKSIRQVYHPLLSSHASHEMATAMYPNGTGGIISFELNQNSAAAVSQLMRGATNLPFSPTLADARTTLSHPASTSHRHLTPAQRTSSGITEGLVRLSVGLEPCEQLRRELEEALDAVQ